MAHSDRAGAGVLHQQLAVFALLTGLVFAAYTNCLHNELIYGDQVLIAGNKFVKSLDYVPIMFLADWFDGTDMPLPWKRYRPLATLTLALNYAVGGVEPFGYHLVNLLLHATVACLLYLLALQLGLGMVAATVSAALFAVHPLHTEAVAVITNRMEMMMALCVLTSLLLAIHGHLRWALLAYLCGLFSKEQAVVLPAVLLLYELCAGTVFADTPSWRSRLRLAATRYAGFVTITALYLSWRIYIFGGFQPPKIPFHLNPLEHVSGLTWLLSTVKMDGHYLWLWVWPRALSAADYAYNAIPLVSSWMDGGLWWALLAWGLLLVIAATSVRQDGRAAFCVGLTILAFLPASNLIIPLGAPVAERTFYLPSAGLCLLVGVGWNRFWQAAGTSRSSSGVRVRSLSLAVLMVVGLAMIMRTYWRNEEWANAEALLTSAIQRYPNNAKAHTLLGDTLTSRRARTDWERAHQAYMRAMHIYPDLPAVDLLFAHNLGVLYLKLGELDKGLALLKQALALDPQSNMVWFSLGRAYRLLGQMDLAESAWRQAIALNPGKAEYHSFLSRLLIENGKDAEGLTEARLAVQADPQYLLGYYNEALALEGMGRAQEALASYDRLLALRPPQEALAEITNRMERLRHGMTEPGNDRLQSR
jgi:tetratricopeptide (TPR) repeat protein